MIGYTCKYTPIELLNGLGAKCVLLNDETSTFQCAESTTHNHLCCHAKAVLENCLKNNVKELILVNCCDSIRRVFDILSVENNLDFLFFLDLPHEETSCAHKRLKSELVRLTNEYSEYKNVTFSYEKFFQGFLNPIQYDKEPFIGIYGGRISSQLLASIRNLISYPLVDYTCNGNRSLYKPDGYEEFEELMDWYAKELLSQIPCMRMTNIGSRKAMFENENLKGIIYNTIKFCDYYSFEYAQLQKETRLPILKVESDFTPQSKGQLSTRVDAFMESIIPQDKVIKNHININYVAGIDSGSTTTNVVVLNKYGEICATSSVRTGAKAEVGATKALESVMKDLNISMKDISYIVATGYGRNNLKVGKENVTEITCHARGAYHLNPMARTIIDIGGQDSKVICLNEDGTVKNFVMNDKCAAGTGRFLEMMARTLEMNLTDMSEIGLKWKKDLTISSMCTVFAESEVVSLIADNNLEADIVHGINKSVATKTYALVNRLGGDPNYMMTGGVARNSGVVKALESKLEASLWVSKDPDLCGALGAALFALDNFTN